MAKPAIVVEGLKELQRALKQADPELRRELRESLVKGAEPARRIASGRAPRGRVRDPHPGQLAGSIRVEATKEGADIGSPLVYAPVIHFARQAAHPGHGHTRPHIRRLTPVDFLIGPVQEQEAAIEREVEAALALLLDRLIGS